VTDSPLALGIPQNPRVQGQTVYWEDWRSSEAVILRAPPDGAVELVHREERVHSSAIHVEGDRIVWARAADRRSDGGFDDVELFKADLRDRPLRPESLGAVPDLSAFSGGGDGQYVYVWNDIEIIDVDTGDRKFFSLAGGRRVNVPMYVTDSELFIRIGLSEGDRVSAKLVDLTRLGPPP